VLELDVLLYEEMVSEDDVLEERLCSLCVCVPNLELLDCRLELQAECIRASR